MSIYLHKIFEDTIDFPREDLYFLYYDEKTNELCIKLHNGNVHKLIFKKEDINKDFTKIKMYEPNELYIKGDFIFDETELFFCKKNTLKDTKLNNKNYYTQISFPDCITNEELNEKIKNNNTFILNDISNTFDTKLDVDEKNNELKKYVQDNFQLKGVQNNSINRLIINNTSNYSKSYDLDSLSKGYYLADGYDYIVNGFTKSRNWKKAINDYIEEYYPSIPTFSIECPYDSKTGTFKAYKNMNLLIKVNSKIYSENCDDMLFNICPQENQKLYNTISSKYSNIGDNFYYNKFETRITLRKDEILEFFITGKSSSDKFNVSLRDLIIDIIIL